MIQRIQSVWYFLAALVMLSLFYFPIYKFKTGAFPLKIGNDYLAIILVVLSIILSLVALFSYKKRKNQTSLTWLNILVCIALQVWLFFEIDIYHKLPENINLQGYFWIGAFIPLITLVLLFLAKGGVRKDEKLLKSLDRLR